MLELLLAVGLATAVSFLCSITEAAFYSFPMSRVERLRKEGKKSGEILCGVLFLSHEPGGAAAQGRKEIR